MGSQARVDPGSVMAEWVPYRHFEYLDSTSDPSTMMALSLELVGDDEGCRKPADSPALKSLSEVAALREFPN